MGQCNRRLFLFTVCTLQLISTIERQVFDLLGYQWLPIAANFLHIVFVIFGFFGGYQYRKSYLITYSVWQVLWLAWNSFVICFYLDIGVLNKNSDSLNLGTGAASWWEVNGIGCRPYFSVNGSLGSGREQLPDVFRPPRPDWVDGCLLNFYYVEVIHASLQSALAIIGLLSVVLILRSYSTEEDAYVSKSRSRATSLYSVQYSSTRGRSSPLEDELELNVNQLGADPKMTPRRVKRRSVSRGSGRHSTKTSGQRSRAIYDTNGMVNEAYSGSMAGTMNSVTTVNTNGTMGRGSRESQRKKRYVNPVNRIMDDSSTSNDSHVQPLPAYFPSSNPNGYPPPPVGRPPASLPPTHHATSAASNTAAAAANNAAALAALAAGHSNPLYQSSRPASVYSISGNIDLDYRPPSAHSSYSNWHGQRPSMPLPSSGHSNLHGHSPTPSLVVNSFGISGVAVAQAPSSSAGVHHPRSTNNYAGGHGRSGHYQ